MPIAAAVELYESIKTLGPEALFSRRVEEGRMVKRIDQKDCSTPEISQLIELFGFDFLIETLQLSDLAFAFCYPGVPLGLSARQDLADAVREHFKHCVRCQLISENHRWADGQLSELFMQGPLRFKLAGQGG